MVRLTDLPDMTLDVYRGGKTTMQQQPYQHIPIQVLNYARTHSLPGHEKIFNSEHPKCGNTSAPDKRG